MLLMLVLMPLVSGDICTIRQSTDPGATSKLPCVFPFTYLGSQHDACTVAGHPEGLAWCSTRTEGGQHVEGGGHWGLCDFTCPQETTCPKGWTHLPTGCYLLDKKVRTMAEASDFCLARGASLLNLTSLEQSQELQDWWEGRGREGQCGRQAPALWLSIHRLGDSQQWGEVTTNMSAEFTQWYSTEPNNHGGHEDCAIVITDPALAKATQTANFGWMDVPCNTKQFPFHQNFQLTIWTLCQREVNPKEHPAREEITEEVKVEMTNGCLPGYTNLDSGCYMFSNQPGTAQDGQEMCRKTGGYLVEVDSKNEWEVLGEEWEKVKKAAKKCSTDHPFFWLGVSDTAQEGSWRLGRSGEEVNFTAWEEEWGEPNNWGPGGAGTGGEPGEDCVVAGFREAAWKWHDAPCGSSLFPLCEQLQGEDLENWRREGQYDELETTDMPLNSSWVRVGRYTFLPTLKGVTWADAGALCEEAGGSLAAPGNVEEWEELREAIESAWPQPGIMRSLVTWMTGAEDSPRHGWWLAATDAREEGRWRWQGSKENISYSSAWFNYSPRNENLFSFGGADCAIAVHRQNFLRRSLEQIAEGVKQFGGKYEPDPKDDQDWRDVLEAEEEDIKWTDASCFATFIPGFNIYLSPVCQMDN